MNVVLNWFISKLSSSCVYYSGFLSPFRPPLRPHSPPRASIWTRGGARQLLRAHCSFAYSFFGNALEWLLKGTWAASTLHREREREGKRVRRNCSPRRCFTQDVLFCSEQLDTCMDCIYGHIIYVNMIICRVQIQLFLNVHIFLSLILMYIDFICSTACWTASFISTCFFFLNVTLKKAVKCAWKD